MSIYYLVMSALNHETMITTYRQIWIYYILSIETDNIFSDIPMAYHWFWKYGVNKSVNGNLIILWKVQIPTICAHWVEVIIQYIKCVKTDWLFVAKTYQYLFRCKCSECLAGRKICGDGWIFSHWLLSDELLMQSVWWHVAIVA